MSLNGLSKTLLTNEQILAGSTDEPDPFPARPLERTSPLAGASFSASSLSPTSPNIVVINNEVVEIAASLLGVGEFVSVLVFKDGRPVPYEAKLGVPVVVGTNGEPIFLGVAGHYRLVLSSDDMVGRVLVNRTISTSEAFSAWVSSL